MRQIRRATKAIRQDLGYALSVSLSIAVTTALVGVATSVSTAAYHQVDLPHAETLVMLAIQGRDGLLQKLSTEQWNVIRQRQGLLRGATAYSLWVKKTESVPLRLAFCSDCSVLSGAPAATDPTSPSAIISKSLSSTDAGSSVRINGQVIPISGISLTSYFRLEPNKPVDVWLPLEAQPTATGDPDLVHTEVSARWLSVFGWLEPNLSIATAQSLLTKVLSDARLIDDRTAVVVRSARYGNPWQPAVSPSLLAGCWTLAVVILLSTATNLVILGLTRSVRDEGVVATEIALGARRKDVVGRAMWEWVIAAAPGVAVGLGCAATAGIWYGSLTGLETPYRSANFAIVTPSALLAAIIVVAPAFSRRLLHSSSANATSLLLRGSAGVATVPLRRFRLILGFQCGLGAALLGVGLLLTQSLTNLLNVNLGFEPRGLYAASIVALPGKSIPIVNYATGLRALGGIRGATLLQALPIGESSSLRTIFKAGSSKEGVESNVTLAGPGAMRVLGSKIEAGRDFDDSDLSSASNVAIVNRTLARKLWNSEEALGKRIVVSGRTYEIIATVADGKYLSISEAARPFAYLSLHGVQELDSIYVAASSSSPSNGLPSILRDRVLALSAGCCSVGSFVASEASIERWFFPLRATVSVVRMASVALVMLAVQGVFCVVGVALRSGRRESAIRQCLGASPLAELTLPIRRTLPLCLGGSAIGIIIAGLGALATSRLLYGVRPFEPTVLIAAAATIMTAVALACLAATMAFGNRGNLVANLQ